MADQKWMQGCRMPDVERAYESHIDHDQTLLGAGAFARPIRAACLRCLARGCQITCRRGWFHALRTIALPHAQGNSGKGLSSH